MRCLLLVLAALFAVALATSPRPVLSDLPVRLAWESFKAKYAKEYASAAEEKKRFTIFKGNFEFINAHNKRTDVTYTVGINAFADMTNPEFVSMMNGYRPSTKPRNEATFKLGSQSCPPGNSGSSDYNSTCDWRVANVVTPVKNQGQCGSCWSFSTTGSTEGAHALATGNLVSLSEQNLIDCSDAEGDMGCNGGLMDDAFTYIIKNKGIDTEASYPYQAVDGNCHYKNTSIGATLSSFQDIPKGNEAALAAAIQTVGPVSVAIDAAGISFQFYKSGIYYDLFCSSTNLDHGVLAVGLGTGHTILGTHDYYIVKNSWGSDWGQAGYLFMSRNRNNNCGIATQASYPIAGSSTAASNSGPAASNSGPAASGPAASNSGPAASGPAASHSGPASNSGPSNSGPAASHTTSASASSGKTQSSSGKTQSSSGQASSGSSGNSSGSSNNSSGSSGASSGASSGSSGQGSSASSGSEAPRRLVDA